MYSRKLVIYSMLLLTAASAVIYTFGLLSDFTAVSFVVISFCLLFLSIVKLGSALQDITKTIDSTEQSHFYSAYKFRTFIDSTGDIWLRESDLRKYFNFKDPVKTLANKPEEHFRKINPAIEAWYVHPKALRKIVGNNLKEADEALTKWLENNVIGVHYGLKTIGDSRKTVQKLHHKKQSSFWFARLWRGELGLFKTIVLGGITVYLLVWIFNPIYPKDFLANYRLCGTLQIARMLTCTVAILWWGHGLIMAIQRWIVLERSVFTAFIAIGIAGYILASGLGNLVATENQYDFVDWLTIATDTDNKPVIRYEPISKSIIIYGELGFGTSKSLRQVLSKHPDTKIIGLRSYGGRVVEGSALYNIIRKGNLDTYAWLECMSACVDAYIGGKNRYVIDSAKFGLHRAGQHWVKHDGGLSEADYNFINMMRGAGVSEELIQRGMVPSIHEIYRPTVKEAVASHLATVRLNKPLYHLYDN